MITVFASADKEKAVKDILRSVERMDEVVHLSCNLQQDTDIIVTDLIRIKPDWKNTRPPVLYPDVAFNNSALTGIIHTLLGNYEAAYPVLEDNKALLDVADLANRLQHGIETKAGFTNLGSYIRHHNKAISLYYSAAPHHTAEEINNAFDEAIPYAPDEEYAAFTSWHWAMFLLDIGEYKLAAEIIQPHIPASIPKEAVIALKNTLCNIWLQQLSTHEGSSIQHKLKEYLWECLEYYEQHNRSVEAALVLNEASHVATLSNSFSEALGYSNRAIEIFRQQHLTELEAQAWLNKGNLLHSWAINDNPQFYRTAIQAYQEALKVFTKEETPDVFANIHHQLGIVYAQIPEEVKKKSVWAGVSVASFNEALLFYNKVDFPYEFAVICRSFGHAFTQYPQAVHTDNFDKALAWYREALDIFTAQEYPAERVRTLEKYMEASWYAGNKADYDEERYEDMIKSAQEILQLTHDENTINIALGDIKKLQEIKLQASGQTL